MFTDEEVDAAVRRYLSTDVTMGSLKTGNRDVLTAKEQIYDLVTTALLLDSGSYYYVIWLASNKLTALVNQQLTDVTTIVTAAPNVSRPSKLLGPPTELVNAEAAIIDLTAAFTSRTQGVAGSIGPAVERFRTSVERYIKTELVKNVVVAGDVVETGPELKQRILDTWLEARDRHTEIVSLAQAINDALTTFRRVRLPDSAIQKIVTRVQAKIQELQTTLSGTTAVRDSRGAMLDLLAQRTLLLRSSSFRVPATRLVPLGTDVSQGTLVNSAGARSALTGTISAPFNYGLSSSLDLTINGGSPVTVPFPGSSRAEARSSVTLTFPSPTGMEAACAADGNAVEVLSSTAWADGPTAAAALDAAFTNASVTWDGTASQLVFRGLSTADVASLSLLSGTTTRDAFLFWAFGGSPQQTYGVPLEISDLSPLFPSDVVASGVLTEYASFYGERSATGGEEAVIWNRVALGTDLVSNGTTTLTSTAVDLETRGVIAGMILVVTAPTPLQRVVVSVDGGTIEVDAAVPANTNTFYVGPDYTAILVGTRVSLSSPANRGFYRTVAAAPAKITLDRNIAVAETGISARVYSEFLRVELRGTTTTSGLAATASAGATAVGIAVAAEQKAQLAQFHIAGSTDFLARGVVSGDVLRLVSPSAQSYDTTVVSVAAKDLVFNPPVRYEAGFWTYAVDSALGVQYDALASSVTGFLASVDLEAADVELVITRLIRGARYTTELQDVIETYQAELGVLLAAAGDYVIERNNVIDQVVRTFEEEGYDRALDLFTGLRLDTLFSMGDDGVSYSSWLTRQSATVAREVVPITKDPRDSTSAWRTLSAQSTSFDPRAEPETK